MPQPCWPIRVHINGKLVVSPTQKYTVHEIQAPSGAVVREFTLPTGIVFGVAWSGPTMPDLRQVLGSYFDQYLGAAAQRNQRGPVLIEQPGLVVQSGGHMRAFIQLRMQFNRVLSLFVPNTRSLPDRRHD